METMIYIPKEDDIKLWVKEAVNDFFEEKNKGVIEDVSFEPLVSRQEVADMLGVSLVTLTSWVNGGLPCYKNEGRVYFLKSEVVEYIRQKKR